MTSHRAEEQEAKQGLKVEVVEQNTFVKCNLTQFEMCCRNGRRTCRATSLSYIKSKKTLLREMRGNRKRVLKNH